MVLSWHELANLIGGMHDGDVHQAVAKLADLRFELTNHAVALSCMLKSVLLEAGNPHLR